jgi:hypothetical protein
MKRSESTKNQSNKRPRRSLRIGQQQFGPFWTENTNDAPTVSLTVSNTSSVDRLTNLPELVVDHQLISFMGIVEVAMMREVNRYFEPFWVRRFVDHNLFPICIPYDFPTIEKAMSAIDILSIHKQYTEASPLVVQLGKGEHQITSSWTGLGSFEYVTTVGITRSNITFLGKGKDETTILGGFAVDNSENITFKNMTVTNTSEYGRSNGINMTNAKVKLFDVAFKGCGHAALDISNSTSETATLVATRCEFANSRYGAIIDGSLTSAKFNNCVFNDNVNDGISGWDQSTIHLHGEATAIHSNAGYGIRAIYSSKVVIHLSSYHNTSYNNGGQDRNTSSGGTITNVE